MSFAVLQQPRRAATRCAASSRWARRIYPCQRVPQARSTNQNRNFQKNIRLQAGKVLPNEDVKIYSKREIIRQNAKLANSRSCVLRNFTRQTQKLITRNARHSHQGEAHCYYAHTRLRFENSLSTRRFSYVSKKSSSSSWYDCHCENK